jgi:hypothetical protein
MAGYRKPTEEAYSKLYVEDAQDVIPESNDYSRLYNKTNQVGGFNRVSSG